MPATKLVPVNLRLPESLIEESDLLAEKEGSSRTELVRTALRSYIERRKRLQVAIDITQRLGKEAGINTQEDLDLALQEIQEA